MTAMLLDASESQLVLVDYQERLMPAIFEAEAVLANARRLAQIARLMDVPVWGTEQNPSRLGLNDAALRALCQRTLSKMHFSATEEGLGEWLRPPAKAQGGKLEPEDLPAAAEREKSDALLRNFKREWEAQDAAQAEAAAASAAASENEAIATLKARAHAHVVLGSVYPQLARACAHRSPCFRTLTLR